MICTVGSSGDVHPFVGLGRELQQRGHRVTLITAGYFRALADASGFDFIDTMPDCNFQALINDPNLWHATRGTQRVLELAVQPTLEPIFQAIERLYLPGSTHVIASSLAFGARVAEEKLHVPLTTVHLSPVLFRSELEGPRLPRLMLHLGPRWFKRVQWWVADHFVIDSLVCPWLNAFRSKHGLPPTDRVFRDWWHSPRRVIAMFPEWFAAKQPDWPKQTILTGFPLYSEDGITPIPAELEQFLEDGPAPIAFTPGSANLFGERFFRAAADACQLLGTRGVLLTRFAEQIPKSLPNGVRHFPFAPFKQLLPRCLALVHHGGIGSLSQAFAAGIPQIIMPMGFDQIDNAHRVRRLRAGGFLQPSRFSGRRLASMLRRFVDNPTTVRACQEIARSMSQSDSLAVACDAIEGN